MSTTGWVVGSAAAILLVGAAVAAAGEVVRVDVTPAGGAKK